MSNNSCFGSAFTKYSNTVAGHNDLLSNEEGDFLVKPTNPTEILFYEQSCKNPDFCDFLPTFYGTLQLQNNTSCEASSLPQVQHICFENIVSTYKNPSIIDIKIGTRLYDDDASQEKIKKMQIKAKQTTSSTLGVRICGLRVYKNTTSLQNNLLSDLSCNSDSVDSLQSSLLIQNSCIQDITCIPITRQSDYCRKLNNSTLADELDFFFSNISDTPLFKAYRSYLLDSIVDELQNFLELINTLEFRLYSSSLLIVYESDINTIIDLNSKMNFFQIDLLQKPTDHNIKLLDTNFKGYLDSDKYDGCGFNTNTGTHHNDSDSASDISDYGSTNDIAHTELYDFRAIDFAHSKWTPGIGPDEQYIFGIKNLIDILLKLK
ncbi:hypothetical protein BB561_001341 [Smittium simulii]|uniref:Kinase n=1 Tax=Smittium simulii TaxID=133385 RepID=A0A2T9YV02_9FUNG|nr:hypothetical protein BB561_001341 [Smittium simulii]